MLIGFENARANQDNLKELYIESRNVEALQPHIDPADGKVKGTIIICKSRTEFIVTDEIKDGVDRLNSCT